MVDVVMGFPSESRILLTKSHPDLAEIRHSAETTRPTAQSAQSASVVLATGQRASRTGRSFPPRYGRPPERSPNSRLLPNERRSPPARSPTERLGPRSSTRRRGHGRRTNGAGRRTPGAAGCRGPRRHGMCAWHCYRGCRTSRAEARSPNSRRGPRSSNSRRGRLSRSSKVRLGARSSRLPYEPREPRSPNSRAGGTVVVRTTGPVAEIAVTVRAAGATIATVAVRAPPVRTAATPSLRTPGLAASLLGGGVLDSSLLRVTRAEHVG